mgnify:FL=1
MSTRAMGVLFSNGGIYSVYNIEQKNTNWVDRSEINFSAYAYSVGMRKEMKQEDNKSRALIFYRNEKRIRDVLIGDKNKNYLSLGQCGFDWQKPGIEEFVGNAATIRVIPFDRCQNMLTENCK